MKLIQNFKNFPLWSIIDQYRSVTKVTLLFVELCQKINFKIISQIKDIQLESMWTIKRKTDHRCTKTPLHGLHGLEW